MSHSVDLLVIYPNNRKRAYGSLGDAIAAVTPPVEVGLIAGYARSKGFSVAILDADALNLSPDQTAQKVFEINPVLAGVATDHLNSGDVTKMAAASETMTALHKKPGSYKTMLFGVTPSAYPEKTLTEDKPDYVCQGEGYVPISELLKVLKTGEGDASKIQGLWFLDKGGALVTSKRPELWSNPDELPMVPWDLLPMEKYRCHYWHSMDNLQARAPYAAIYTNMGCPYDCSFCSVNIVFGKPNLRMRTPESVVQEIDYLVSKYKVRNIRIVDNVFTIRPATVEKFCDLLIAKNYDLNFWAYARVETVRDLNLAKKMKKAGINWLAYGIEAGDFDVRKGVSKASSQSMIDKAVGITQEAGINIVGNFIFGLPDDSMATMQKTFDYAKLMNFEFANFYFAMAYPGTELHEQAKKDGLPLPTSWEQYGQYSEDALPLPTKHLTPAEIVEFRDNAFREYYTSPRYLNMLEKKFGRQAVDFTADILKHTIRRKIVEQKRLATAETAGR